MSTPRKDSKNSFNHIFSPNSFAKVVWRLKCNNRGAQRCAKFLVEPNTSDVAGADCGDIILMQDFSARSIRTDISLLQVSP